MKGKKSKKEEEEQPDVCAVCRGSHWQGEEFEQLRCQLCDSTVHKNCYFPDFKEKDRSRFKCDPCRKRGSKGREKEILKYPCSHCGQSEGVLKDVGLGEWMHVLCALTSPRVVLQSYTTLSFAAEGAASKHINKQRKCTYCKNDKGEGLPCCIEGCRVYIHLTCVVDYAGVAT
jgi:hypothetical protein